MNYLLRNILISLRDIAKNLPRALLASFGIIFLIASMIAYLSLRRAVQEYVGGTLFGSLQINEMVVSARAREAKGLLELGPAAAGIPPARVRRIAAMEGVARVQPVIRLDFPARVKAEMLGRVMREQVPVYGVKKEFLAKTVRNWRRFNAGKELPVVVPKFALEVFNSMIAGRGLPKFGEGLLVGFPIDIEIRTTPRGDPEKRVYEYAAKVFGFTEALPVTGLVLPYDFIVRFCEAHRNDSRDGQRGYSYAKLFLTVRDVKEIPRIAGAIGRMGLAVESQQDIAAKTNRAMSIIDGSSLVILGVFLVLTVIAIVNSYLTIVYHRSRRFSLLRIVGMSKLRIIMTFIAEAALIGALYGALGCAGGLALMDLVAENLAKWMPALAGLSLSIDMGRGELFAISIGISALVSSASALVPAIIASNMNLFKAVQR